MTKSQQHEKTLNIYRNLSGNIIPNKNKPQQKIIHSPQ